MKFCPNCHLTYDDTANVCGQCGGPLQIIPQQVQQQVAYDPTDHTAEFSPQDISDNKVFHVRQGLKISVVSILVTIVGALIPFLGWIAAGVCAIILLVVQIICFFRVCKGEAKEVPIIKNFGFLK